jgi:hypothetical protein
MMVIKGHYLPASEVFWTIAERRHPGGCQLFCEAQKNILISKMMVFKEL